MSRRQHRLQQWLVPLAAALLVAACQPVVRPTPPPVDPAPVSLPAPVPETPVAPATPPAEVSEPVPPTVVEVDTVMDTGAEVFARLESRLTSPICVKGEHNRTWRKRYAGHPQVFARHVEQSLPLMAYVLEQVEASGLPGEFALIPLVESWYRPGAIGPGGPAGMWQMIGSTARNHGIVVRSGYDGRLSPVESTDAALSYLKTLYGMFGEWRATAMAYNAGEYRLLRAFRSVNNQRVSGERRLPRGLSRTTYDYVAKLHALACLVAEPARHDLRLPVDARFVPLRAMELPAGATSLEAAAMTLGTEAAALRALNPAYRQGRIVAGAPRRVLVPATSLVLVADLARGATMPVPESPSESQRVHVVARGDTLSALARRYGVDLGQLLRLNGLGTRSILRIGQTLRVD